ncbi:MAG: hypothetical protein AAFY60_10315, partial [Myxococcota bacterium]
ATTVLGIACEDEVEHLVVSLAANACGAASIALPLHATDAERDALAAQAGVPALAMNASLAYFDSIRTARLPQNLTQAQRDAFGAHTYQTVSNPDGPAVHSEWLES